MSARRFALSEFPAHAQERLTGLTSYGPLFLAPALHDKEKSVSFEPRAAGTVGYHRDNDKKGCGQKTLFAIRTSDPGPVGYQLTSFTTSYLFTAYCLPGSSWLYLFTTRARKAKRQERRAEPINLPSSVIASCASPRSYRRPLTRYHILQVHKCMV